jgi:predicted metalloprotease
MLVVKAGDLGNCIMVRWRRQHNQDDSTNTAVHTELQQLCFHGIIQHHIHSVNHERTNGTIKHRHIHRLNHDVNILLIRQ